MAWVYLDDNFPDHPKVVAAGADAAWLFVCGLAYCKRYGTDGRIPKAQVTKLVTGRSSAGLARKLTQAPAGYDAGLWEDHGDHYLIHDYGEWNASSEARSKAGRRGAASRWRGKRNAIANANAPPLPSRLPSQSHQDRIDFAIENASDLPCETHWPLPSPPSSKSLSPAGRDSRAPTDDDDDEKSSKTDDNQDIPGVDVEAVIQLLAERDTRSALDSGHVRVANPDAYQRGCAQSRRARNGPEITRLVDTHRNWNATQIADAIDTPNGTQTGRLAEFAGHDFPDNLADAHARATQARAALGTTKSGPGHPTHPDHKA